MARGLPNELEDKPWDAAKSLHAIYHAAKARGIKAEF
jgi:hypothetical protein